MGTQNAQNSSQMMQQLYDLYYGAGTAQQTAQQGQYDNNYQNAANAYNQKLAALQGLQGIIAGNYGNDTVTTQSGGTNATGQILGAAASAVAAYYSGGASLAAEKAYTDNRAASQGAYTGSQTSYSYGKALDNLFGGASDGGTKTDFSYGGE
jgi:hypothetical protein